MESKTRLIADRYQLLAAVGSGGMGTVWRARDELLDREVAVKEVILPPGLSETEHEHLRERTRREARAAARITCSSAVTVYDVVEQDGHPFLVMEFVEARNLSEVIRDDGPLTPRRTAEVGLAVLDAIEAAHAQGILHRDVKPGNVLLQSDGRVVLTDFGIATARGDASITNAGLLLGSPSYIAPERARGHSPGPASDLWSLGATLFTAVEGRPAFDTGEPLTTMTAVVTGEHEPYVASGPLVPVLTGLLEKDPDRRLGARGARSGLRAVLSAPEGTATLTPPAFLDFPDEVTAPEHHTAPFLLPVRRGRKRRRAAALTAAAVVIAAAGTVGFVVANGNGGTGGTATATSHSPAPSASGGVPASWATYSDPSGWSVRYPSSWQVGRYSGQPQLRDPQTRRTIRLGPAALGSDPLASLTSTANSFGHSHSGYQQLRLEKDGSDAVWEFTFSDGVDLHVVDHALASGFAVYAQAHSDDWAGASPEFRKVLGSLRTG